MRSSAARPRPAIALEWADKAQALLALAKLNLADALAWQRDAAKAGAPLSKEPLAGLKAQLVERVRAIEDLQHRVQVQREAAVLLAQRIEVLSTKPWTDAQSTQDALAADVAHWQAESDALVADANWSSVDIRFRDPVARCAGPVATGLAGISGCPGTHRRSRPGCDGAAAQGAGVGR